MLTGTTPFRDVSNQQIYQRIANGIDMAKFLYTEVGTNVKKEVNFSFEQATDNLGEWECCWSDQIVV